MQGQLVGRATELQRLRRALRRGAIHAAVISGPAGVGKTRLAREWIQSAAQHRPTVSVTGTTATTPIPFGVFAPLLPDNLPADSPQFEVLQAARQSLFERATDGRGLALLVDDAHLLDDASAALVHQLVDNGDAFVVLTIRDDEPAPDPIVAVGKDDRVEWIELAPLDRDEVEALAEQLLDDPIDGAAAQQLWDRTGGNPLFVTELIRGGVEAGVLVCDGGLWHADGPLTVSARLRQVLAARLRDLPADQRDALQLVAAANRFELWLTAPLVNAAALAALEQHGLVTVEQDRRRETVAVAHPLYAETARAETRHLDGRELAAALASQLELAGLRRRDDLLRWATWQLQAGRPAPPARLLAAARRAKVALDPTLAERCADAAVAAGGGFDARLLRAEAMAAQGRTGDADAEFTELTAEACDDAERAQAALAHATSLLLHVGDRRVLDVLDAAAETVSDPAWADELRAMLVFSAAYLGELSRAVEEGGKLLARANLAPSAAVRTAVIHTYALVLVGRTESTDEAIEPGLTAARRHPEAFPIAEQLLVVTRVFALETSGRIRQAETLARNHYCQAVTDGSLELRGLWATNLGFALHFRGDLPGFARHLDEAVAALQQRDPVGMLLLALSLAALAHAMTGRRGRARRLLTVYDTHAEGRTPAFGTTWRHRVDAWLHPGGAGLDAAELALHAGQIAQRERHVAYGSLALHDAVRFGHPELVADLLDDFAGAAEGEFIPTLAAHARSLQCQNTTELDEVSRRFEAMGADLYAAEAAAQASHLHCGAGEQAAAQAARLRALTLAGSGASCPTLWRWIDRPGRLTDRELEISRLAASGLTDRDIAEQLTISPRTVSNHLASVYDKLGVAGRDQLAPLLVPTEPPST